MKKLLFFFVIFLVFAGIKTNAQYVSVRLDFPVGVRRVAPPPPPFKGAVWIGPEWRWQRGRYVCVPGYWARPRRYGAVWMPGHWGHSHKGHRWVPGHWK